MPLAVTVLAIATTILYLSIMMSGVIGATTQRLKFEPTTDDQIDWPVSSSSDRLSTLTLSGGVGAGRLVANQQVPADRANNQQESRYTGTAVKRMSDVSRKDANTDIKGDDDGNNNSNLDDSNLEDEIRLLRQQQQIRMNKKKAAAKKRWHKLVDDLIDGVDVADKEAAADKSDESTGTFGSKHSLKAKPDRYKRHKWSVPSSSGSDDEDKILFSMKRPPSEEAEQQQQPTGNGLNLLNALTQLDRDLQTETPG